MIGKLKGILDESGEDWVLLDVNGVGYIVSCSARTLANLPPRGEAYELLIETYVREDQIRLFGFGTALERDWFNLLQSVQGVGAKLALTILSTLSSEELTSAVMMEDKASVSRTPGVGPKVAQRIVSELKDKTPAGPLEGLSGGGSGGDVPTGVLSGSSGDAISALVNLGYSRSMAGAAVAKIVQSGDEHDTAALIRLGLKELSQ